MRRAVIGFKDRVILLQKSVVLAVLTVKENKITEMVSEVHCTTYNCLNFCTKYNPKRGNGVIIATDTGTTVVRSAVGCSSENVTRKIAMPVF